MGLPVEHEPVGTPLESTRRGALFTKKTSLDHLHSETPQEQNHFYETIKNKWQSFCETKMTRRAFLKGSGKLSLRTFAVSLVVAGLHPEQVDLGINWLVTEMAEPDPPLVIPENAEGRVKKAMLLYNNMITKFGTHNELMLENTRDKNLIYAQVWPYTRAIEAAYAMRFVPGAGNEPRDRYKSTLSGLDDYWSNKPEGYLPGYDPGLTALNSYNVPTLRPFTNSKGPDRYVDDNLWIGQILMRDYWETKNKRSLYRAKQIFDLAASQWDQVQGGVYWKQQFPNETAHGRGMVSNAPAIMLGVELHKALYEDTGDESYLTFCDKTYKWIQDNLRDSEDGLYFDNKDYTGAIGKEKFTYCQGIMMGAMVKLNELDPARYPLADAIKLANDSLTFFDNFEKKLKSAERKHDPNDTFSEGYEDLAYTGIYFANLLYLAGKEKNVEFTNRVQGTLDRIVSRLHTNHEKLLDQAGAVHLAALNCMAEEEYKYAYLSPLFIGAKVS